MAILNVPPLFVITQKSVSIVSIISIPFAIAAEWLLATFPPNASVIGTAIAFERQCGPALVTYPSPTFLSMTTPSLTSPSQIFRQLSLSAPIRDPHQNSTQWTMSAALPTVRNVACFSLK